MADHDPTAEKRNSVALAATLFGEETTDSDIFGTLDERPDETQPYPATQDGVDNIFGSSNATRNEAEDFFSDRDATGSGLASYYPEAPTESEPAAYSSILTNETWSNDTAASGWQAQPYPNNYEQWQAPSYALHEQDYGSTPSFGPSYHEMTVSQQSEPSASQYQPTSNPASSTAYDPYAPHGQTSHTPHAPADPAPPTNAYNSYAPVTETPPNGSDPRNNDVHNPYAPPSSSYATTTQTYTSTPYQTSSYQTPTLYHASYESANGNLHSYSAPSPYGDVAKETPPAAAVDVGKFRTGAPNAYDPPTIPTRKSAFRNPPPPTNPHVNKIAAPYDHVTQRPVASDSRYISPPPPAPPPAHSPVVNWNALTVSPPPVVAPPRRSSRTQNLPPTAPTPLHPPSLPSPSVAPSNMASLTVPPPRTPSVPPPGAPASTNGVLQSGNVSEGEDWLQDEIPAPDEPTVTLAQPDQSPSDSLVHKSGTVSNLSVGMPDDDDDLGLANPSSKTSQWDAEESSVDPAAPPATSNDYVVPYPPVTDHRDNEEVRVVEDGHRDHEVQDIEGDPTPALGADAGNNGFTPSNIHSNDCEAPPSELHDTAFVPLPYAPGADAEIKSSVAYDPYAPSVAAGGPPPAAPRIPSPPKRTISDSPSPYIPSMYSSDASRYAPPPPAQKPSLNTDLPPASNTHSHYQPPTGTFVPPATLYELSSLAPPPSSTYSSSPSQPSIYSLPVPHASSHDVSPVQRNVYAPSPSQSAADDPRTTTHIPVFNFGFGGKVVTCFHSRTDMNAGFDVALAGRPSGIISIRSLKSITSESLSGTSAAEFPGPLFTGNTVPTIALGRATGTQSSAVKTKKTAVLRYVNERADELEKGLGYLSSTKDDAERRSTEGRVVLLRLLGVMIDNDGKLSGTPELAEQIRTAILPAGGVAFMKHSASSSPTIAVGFGAPTAESFNETREQPLATYQVCASSLDRVQSLLLSGKRREACHYALDQKMWAHAMIISSSMDKEVWKDVVNEFIRTELGVQMNDPAAPLVPASAVQGSGNGRESMRVLYSLFSGQGTAAVQELLPPKNLSKAGESTHITRSAVQPTPISPNFPKPTLIPAGVLSRWAETAASVVSNVNGVGEPHATLTALGDHLVSNNWVEAAHACYLLSMQTSPLGGVGAASVRMTLVGSDSPGVRRNFHIDIDAIRYTEVVEFALSLLPPAKEPFGGLPHLQPYKLLRAWQLAELGLVKEATKYCEAITAILRANPRGSPFFTMTFLELHQELSSRLAGTADKNSSWISRTIKTPSMDSLGSWSLNKLTKFIEGDEPSPIPEETPSNEQSTIGPFSHYNEISSATTSQLPSPSGSIKGMSLADGGPPAGPPRRSGSALGSHTSVPAPPDRSASAMGYVRPIRNSPPGKNWSAGPGTTTFPQVANHPDSNGPNVFTPKRDSTSSYISGWWGSANGNAGGEAVDTDTGTTPTATAFQPNGNADTGNFVSLMDSYTPARTPTLAPAPTSTTHSSRNAVQEEEEEDLGLGNASRKRNKPAGTTKGTAVASAAEETAEKEKAKKEKEAPSDPPASASKGWLSSWWGSSKSDKPKPIRANLGEAKSSFYYDKELKRWVNGNEGASATPTTAPPPPPSRAQTASPSKMGGTGISSTATPPPNSSTPPPRAQSTDLTNTRPPRATPPGSARTPSGLSTSFVPPAPGDSGDGPPSASPAPPRARSAQGQRRNARARYVDVFATPPPSS